MGLLITAILVVNNLRDMDSDRAVGKITLAVRIGAKGTRYEYLTCLIGAYIVPFGIWYSYSSLLMLTWLSLPLAYSLIRFVWNHHGRPLNQALAGTGRLTLIYSILYSLGLILHAILA